MNTTIKTILATLTMGATAIAAQAQTTTVGQPTTPRVVVVSIGLAMNNYYRAAEASNQIQNLSQQAQKTMDGLGAEAKAMYDKIKPLQDAIQSPVATDAAKKAAQEQGQRILQDLQKKEQEINDFRQKATADIQNGIMQMRQQLITEIAAKASDIGKTKGATMIADRDQLVYADPAMDITQEVIAALNQGHPMPVSTGTAAPAVSYPAR